MIDHVYLPKALDKPVPLKESRNWVLKTAEEIGTLFTQLISGKYLASPVLNPPFLSCIHPVWCIYENRNTGQKNSF